MITDPLHLYPIFSELPGGELFHTTTFIGAVHKVLRTLLHCVGFKVDETVLG